MSVQLMGRDKIAGRENIELLIPHAGKMVLLDAVQHWDDSSILCRAETHRHLDNPLRDQGGLSVYAGLEYAAQAMALHSCLRAKETTGERIHGLVAVASKVITQVEWLQDLDGDLLVLVNLLTDAGDSSLYEFSLTANERMLVCGRLLVVLVQQ